MRVFAGDGGDVDNVRPRRRKGRRQRDASKRCRLDVETRGSPPLAPPPRVCGEDYLTLPYLRILDAPSRRLDGEAIAVARSTELAEPPGPRPPSSRPALPPPAPLWPPLAPVQRRDTVAMIAVGSAARPRRKRGAVPAHPCCPGGVQSRAQRERASYGAI